MAISYGTTADASTYHNARGQGTRWDAITNQADALQRGSEYVDQRYREQLKSGRWVSMFSGTKTGGRTQDREWPRTYAEDYEGNAIPSGTVPDEVEHAAYEAALLEGENPGSLLPSYTASDQVTSEKVGPIEVKYGSGFALPEGVTAPNQPVITIIDKIIAPVLTTRYDLPAVSVV